MGRDPVEHTTCAKYQPPAMRVRDDSYTKKHHLSNIMRVFKSSLMKGKVMFMANKAHSLAHTKWLCKYHIVF
ncbi:MAG: hypothetical protein KBS83_01235, partial [Lachnospiraceae bacterium]|nr:hypothetical protein [Candidatus Equihabitans merdae]